VIDQNLSCHAEPECEQSDCSLAWSSLPHYTNGPKVVFGPSRSSNLLDISPFSPQVFDKLAGVSTASPLPNSQTPAPIPQTPEPFAPSSTPALSLQSTLSSLPPEWPEDPLPEIQEAVGAKNRSRPVMVVLDDDPTGTQTVHGVAVLTEWSVASLQAELEGRPPCFFVLTNSRALHTEEVGGPPQPFCLSFELNILPVL
jgi:hypothetical protein